MVTMRLFGPARDAAGAGTEIVEGATVGAVLEDAVTRYGDRFREVLEVSRVWVNGEPAGLADPVDARDEVAVLPPVSGG